MSPLVEDRLLGCTAESLDSYLRGLGFFLLAGEIEPSIRAWWDGEATLWIASPEGVPGLVDILADQVLGADELIPRAVSTPWRGAAGKNRVFAALRNEADDAELDWFDSCALARGEAGSGGERSDRENNPLLGQGGGFGRSEVAAAHADALALLGRNAKQRDRLAGALCGLVTGAAVDEKTSRLTSVTKAVLGAYQSGRATGPGLSAGDVEPTNQKARTSAWDVVLVLEGLRAFRGVPTRRPQPDARVQSSFPLVVEARPIASEIGEPVEFREDKPDTFEVLAPLWSAPCTARTFKHLLPAARLRTPRGVARDTLDAALVQAAHAAHGLGFDRLVRFAFTAGSDPRYRYAVSRGSLRSRGSHAARQALGDALPFVRRLDSELRRRGFREEQDHPPSLRLARRRLEDALASLASGEPIVTDEERRRAARQTQEALVALALLQPPASRACPEIEAPFLPAAWFGLADDGSPEFRLARELATSFLSNGASWLRNSLLPHRRMEGGRWILDPSRTPVDLDHARDPLRALAEAGLWALRTSDRAAQQRSPRSARLGDLALLLSGELGDGAERRLALLTAALSGVSPATASAPPGGPEPDPLRAGIGLDLARLLLASSLSSPEGAPQLQDERALEQTERLCSLVLAGRTTDARVLADRELRRRGLDVLQTPLPATPAPADPARLALALLLPLDEPTRTALGVVVTTSHLPTESEGGLP